MSCNMEQLKIKKCPHIVPPHLTHPRLSSVPVETRPFNICRRSDEWLPPSNFVPHINLRSGSQYLKCWHFVSNTISITYGRTPVTPFFPDVQNMMIVSEWIHESGFLGPKLKLSKLGGVSRRTGYSLGWWFILSKGVVELKDTKSGVNLFVMKRAKRVSLQ